MNLPAMIGNGLAWFLLWLFAQAAYHKLGAPQYYRQLMTRYAGGTAGGIAVWLVAAVEAGIALSLLVSRWRTAGLAVAAALLLFYAGLMASQILRGSIGMQCGCAGPESQLGISWALVIRNLVCAGLALLAITSPAGGGGGWLGAGLSLFVAAFAALVYVTSEQIISNAQWMAGES
jgi:hypothetical protein